MIFFLHDCGKFRKHATVMTARRQQPHATSPASARGRGVTELPGADTARHDVDSAAGGALLAETPPADFLALTGGAPLKQEKQENQSASHTDGTAVFPRSQERGTNAEGQPATAVPPSISAAPVAAGESAVPPVNGRKDEQPTAPTAPTAPLEDDAAVTHVWPNPRFLGIRSLTDPDHRGTLVIIPRRHAGLRRLGARCRVVWSHTDPRFAALAD